MTDEAKALEQTALAWPDRAKAIVIRDQQSYDHAADLIREIVTLRKQVIEHHKPIKEAAHAAHKAALAAEKKLLDPLQHAEAFIKRGIGAWDMEQQRIRAERQRKLAEAQRKADEDARLALAAEAEAAGATEDTVDEILETPVVEPVMTAPPTYEQARGVSTRLNWRAEVTDLKALCRAIGEGKAPINAAQPNLPVLNAMARAMKQTMNIPGVRAVSEASVAVRT